jgi:predicted nucleic acid-binding protein
MVVLDSSILLLLFYPGAGVPEGKDGKPISRARERVDYLVTQLEKSQIKIIVPAPVLSEVLVRAGEKATNAIVAALSKQVRFRIEAFDTRAAIELALMTREEQRSIGRKKKLGEAETYAKLKFDRQIVAIASVCGAETIYSDDASLRAIAKRKQIEAIGVGDLSLPPNASANLELFDPTKLLRLAAPSE